MQKMNKKKKLNDANDVQITNDAQIIVEHAVPVEEDWTLFEFSQLQRQTFQLLESFYILSNTIKLDVFLRRIEFINKLYPQYIKYKDVNLYNSQINIGINYYETKYPNRIIIDEHLDLLFNPSFDKIGYFYSNSLKSSFSRFVEKQKKEIDNLKTLKAKEKRKELIIRTGYDFKYAFLTYNLADEGHTESIESLRKQFYRYHKIK